MSKKKLVPRLRFKEFEKDGEWKKLCLDELVNIVDGDRGTNYPSKKDFTNDGHTLFLNASNVTKLGFKFEENQYISEIKSNLMGNGKLLLNDIILTSRGSIGNVGIYNERINGKYPYVRINSGMLILRNRNIADSYFIGQYLKSSSGKYQIKLISFGSAQPQLTKNDVSNYSVVHPIDLNEQRRIGDFLNKFDEMLQLQQSKVNKVKDLKSAYLSEMFPKEGEKYPKKRFEGFQKNWRKVRLEQLLNQSGSGGTPSTTREDYYGGDIPFLGISDITNSNGYIFNTEKTITVKGLNNSAAWIVPKESISLAMYASVGKVAILKIESATSQAFYNMVIKKQPTRDYIFQYLVKMEAENMWDRIISTGTQANLNAEKVRNLIIPIPIDIDEQEKIGNFFKNLDKQISIEEEKLTKLEKLKQAYLNDMFV